MFTNWQKSYQIWSGTTLISGTKNSEHRRLSDNTINLSHIVPDPKVVYKSDYTNHAQWMKALYELSRESYDSVLAEWREKHKRRRNLWRDMKSNGLPI